jgi:hypothetical protein
MTRVLSAKPSKGRDASFSKTRSPAQNQPTNPYGKLFSLQRTAGNRATEQMLNSLGTGAIVQRKCACGGAAGASGKCAKCSEEETLLQRDGTGESESSEVPPIVHEVLSSSGQPLNPDTRSFMEERFGYDFNQVRVHTSTKAAESAKAVNALAYTVGRDIVFGTGHYAPNTLRGQQLLAHELTHVIQQRDRFVEDPISGSLATDANSQTLEVEAEQNAARIDNYNSLSVSSLNQAPQIQCEKKSGLSPTTPRPDRDIEAQRLEAIDIVRSNCLKIWATAGKYGVSAEAIAGAILWEALENPYYRPFPRLGPGKVHPYEYIGKSEAEKVEEEKRVPASKDKEERTQRLKQADQAITYIAAIMQRHADNYKKIAGVDITNNPGVLCTLYQGGKSEERAQKLAEKRKKDPNAQPMVGDEMGPWVEQNMDFIKSLCTVGDFVPPSGSTRAA